LLLDDAIALMELTLQLVDPVVSLIPRHEIQLARIAEERTEVFSSATE
jgi:hypothetical protein